MVDKDKTSAVSASDYYKINEVCDLLSVDRSTVMRWIRSGEMDYFKAGSTYRIPKQAVTKLIKKGKK